METPKVAICFFGLIRGAKYSIPSIKEHIYKPLQDAGIQYDIYLHTYSHSEPYNGLGMFNSTNLSITDQREFLRTPIVNKIKQYGDHWKNNFKSLENLLCQLNSLQIVTRMWETKHYSCVIYLRPDLYYHEPICIEHITGIIQITTTNMICIPKWHWYTIPTQPPYNQSGVNDRFAYGTDTAMKIYGNRFNHILAYCEMYNCPLHSEYFLTKIIQVYSIRVEVCDQRASRLRNDHMIQEDGFDYNILEQKYLI